MSDCVDQVASCLSTGDGGVDGDESTTDSQFECVQCCGAYGGGQDEAAHQHVDPAGESVAVQNGGGGSGQGKRQSRSHLCRLCGQSFGYRVTLFEHQNLHFGNRPHVCEICGKRYAARSNLCQHRLTHTTKADTCHVCDLHFDNNKQLLNHLKTHKDAVLQCNACHEQFDVQSALTEHMLKSHEPSVQLAARGSKRHAATPLALKRRRRQDQTASTSESEEAEVVVDTAAVGTEGSARILRVPRARQLRPDHLNGVANSTADFALKSLNSTLPPKKRLRPQRPSRPTLRQMRPLRPLLPAVLPTNARRVVPVVFRTLEDAPPTQQPSNIIFPNIDFLMHASANYNNSGDDDGDMLSPINAILQTVKCPITMVGPSTSATAEMGTTQTRVGGTAEVTKSVASSKEVVVKTESPVSPTPSVGPSDDSRYTLREAQHCTTTADVVIKVEDLSDDDEPHTSACGFTDAAIRDGVVSPSGDTVGDEIAGQQQEEQEDAEEKEAESNMQRMIFGEAADKPDANPMLSTLRAQIDACAAHGLVFACDFCDVVFFERGTFFLHMAMHNQDDASACGICATPCGDKNGLLLHFINQQHDV